MTGAVIVTLRPRSGQWRSRLLPYSTRFSRKYKVPREKFRCGNEWRCGFRTAREPGTVTLSLLCSTSSRQIVFINSNHNYKIHTLNSSKLIFINDVTLLL